MNDAMFPHHSFPHGNHHCKAGDEEETHHEDTIPCISLAKYYGQKRGNRIQDNWFQQQSLDQIDPERGKKTISKNLKNYLLPDPAESDITLLIDLLKSWRSHLMTNVLQAGILETAFESSSGLKAILVRRKVHELCSELTAESVQINLKHWIRISQKSKNRVINYDQKYARV